MGRAVIQVLRVILAVVVAFAILVMTPRRVVDWEHDGKDGAGATQVDG